MLRRLLLSFALTVILATPALGQFGPNPGGPGPNAGPGPGGPAPHEPAPDGRMRHFQGIPVMRPHGPWYHGYGPYLGDAEAYRWLAFTAITLGILDLLNEQQQRAHEAAQVRATTAPIGQRIVWNDGGAVGAVTATRDGTSSNGEYCREFQQEVTVGGRSERAYGTACRQADGAWKIVSSGN